MNLQETLALLEALKSSGVTKFKSLEHDISFGGDIGEKIGILPTASSDKPVDIPVESVENKEATEKLKSLINTLKMSDEELANQIFPDGAV